MSRIKETDPQWLRRKVQELSDCALELSKIGTVNNSANTWTCSKLIGLSYFADIYSKNIVKGYKNFYYIDLFAGSGLNLIEDTGDLILGSAIVAPKWFKYHRPVKAFYIEKEKDKIESLDARLSYLKDNKLFGIDTLDYETIEGECELRVPEILDSLPENAHFLAFIDPYGMNPDKKTMDLLLSRNCDIILTLQSFKIYNQSVSKALAGQVHPETMESFCGGDWWKYCSSDEDFCKRYIENILSPYRGMNVRYHVRSRRKEPYYYDWILAVKETRGGSPWLDGMEQCNMRLDRTTGDAIKGALDIINGRSKALE